MPELLETLDDDGRELGVQVAACTPSALLP
jgi:hypothetical protein